MLDSKGNLFTLPEVNARYYWTGTAPANAPVFNGVDANYGYVETVKDGEVVHYIARSQYTNYENCVQVCHKKDGALSPWEWLNPPMLFGVEYRTTERYLGKPVYRKAITLGNLPNTTTKTIEHGITNLHIAFELSGYDSYAMSLIGGSTSVVVDSTYVYVKTTSDASAKTAVLNLGYIKTRD